MVFLKNYNFEYGGEEMQNKEKKIKVSGRIYGIYYTLTRQKKEKMATIHLEHPDGSRMAGRNKAVIFPQNFKKLSKYIKLDACVQAKGIKDISSSDQIIAQDLSKVASKI